jgi:hypothetical protein
MQPTIAATTTNTRPKLRAVPQAVPVEAPPPQHKPIAQLLLSTFQGDRCWMAETTEGSLLVVKNIRRSDGDGDAALALFVVASSAERRATVGDNSLMDIVVRYVAHKEAKGELPIRHASTKLFDILRRAAGNANYYDFPATRWRFSRRLSALRADLLAYDIILTRRKTAKCVLFEISRVSTRMKRTQPHYSLIMSR